MLAQLICEAILSSRGSLFCPSAAEGVLKRVKTPGLDGEKTAKKSGPRVLF